MIRTRLVFILAALLLMTATTHAVVIPGRWEKVDGLAPGTPIIIELRSGVREECIFQKSNPIDLLFLDAQEIERRVPKTEVKKIESTQKVGDRLKNGAWIGAGVGAAAGILGLYLQDPDVAWGEASGFYLGAGLVGAGLGAIAGTAVDAAIKGHEVLYKAP